MYVDTSQLSQMLLGLALLLRGLGWQSIFSAGVTKIPSMLFSSHTIKIYQVLRGRLMLFPWVWALLLEAPHLPVHCPSQQVQKIPVGMDAQHWRWPSLVGAGTGLLDNSRDQMQTVQSPTLITLQVCTMRLTHGDFTAVTKLLWCLHNEMCY